MLYKTERCGSRKSGQVMRLVSGAFAPGTPGEPFPHIAKKNTTKG